MVRVKVINGTGEEVVIKEGSAGVYRVLRSIAKGDDYVVSVDENATYREYVIVSFDGSSVTLSSDDCIEYSKVTIMYDEHKVESRLYIVPTLRGKSSIADATSDANIGKAVRGASSWFASWFRKEKITPQAGANTGNSAGASGATP